MVYYNLIDMKKTLFDLNSNELLEIKSNNRLPKGIDLEGIEDHHLFKKIFDVRNEPSKIADIILHSRSRGKPIIHKYEAVIPMDIRRKRIELKEKELDIQKEKSKKSTEMWIKVCNIEDRVMDIYNLLKELGKKHIGGDK